MRTIDRGSLWIDTHLCELSAGAPIDRGRLSIAPHLREPLRTLIYGKVSGNGAEYAGMHHLRERGVPMEQSRPQSCADEWSAMEEEARRRRAPRPPRGELTERELHDFLHILGSEMRQARWSAGLTQAQVADMMDTTKSSVSRLERLGPSVPSLTTLCRYADAIDCRLQVRLVSRRPGACAQPWEE